MTPLLRPVLLLACLLLGTLAPSLPAAETEGGHGAPTYEPAEPFPKLLESYQDQEASGVWEKLKLRAAEEPFNLAATLVFFLAICHTFLAPKIKHYAHLVEDRHRARMLARKEEQEADTDYNEDDRPDEVSFGGQILHFLGEVEAIFGFWVLILAAVIVAFKDINTAIYYVGHKVNYTEPLFVVVIMSLASTRPILTFAESCLARIAALGKGTPTAWWLTLLTVGPVLGSFITEPGAMTIAALLLSKQFYQLNPGNRLKYATIGLLFVNVSVGGTFTHFAAPPVLMVAAPWGWDMAYMLEHFGWRALLGIAASTGIYYAFFQKELRKLDADAKLPGASAVKTKTWPIPAWITAVQIVFMAFVVWRAHDPALFIGAFLFFLAFAQATAHHQGRVSLKPALLVGFFLAGLVNHGGLQGWWIQPVLSSLGEAPLFLGATILTAFNDNALITYLATLVPDFGDTLKYAVVAGAVTGGGLTVIANAPNPAGQSILSKYFEDGVSPLELFLWAIVPTAVMAFCFLAIPFHG
jgi:hypothetical protein